MNKAYQKWLDEPSMDEALKRELKAMSASDIDEAFYKDLAFGTGGMRGILGAGTNRLNIYTLRRAIHAYAKHLLTRFKDAQTKGVVIAHDNRYKSVDFAKEAAGVFAHHGIKSYLFDALRPTPELSFAVRHHQALGGIMITASHNPPNYNGVKMYDELGCQLLPDLADQVIKQFQALDDVFALEISTFKEAIEQGFVEMIGEDTDQAYLDRVLDVQLKKSQEKLIDIVFSPLHGTSREIGMKALQNAGYSVYPVEEQMIIDPKFKTVASPNPENEKAFVYAKKHGLKVNADILIATDPDGDRLGLMCKHQGDYVFLTGNQTGAIFIDYLAKTLKSLGKLPPNGIVFNTIVTSEFGATIAKAYGLEVVSTLTGFKFIGEKLQALETQDKTFIMGYEESYGYVIKDFVRDKDAMQAMLLAAEIANDLKTQNKTLIDYLNELYETHGYYLDDLLNIVHEGKQGEALIKEIMDTFRDMTIDVLNDKKCLRKEDYLTSKTYVDNKKEPLDYPKSNVLKFVFEKDTWFVLRPSGTEPKLKVYINVLGKTKADAKKELKAVKRFVEEKITAIEKQKDVVL